VEWTQVGTQAGILAVLLGLLLSLLRMRHAEIVSMQARIAAQERAERRCQRQLGVLVNVAIENNWKIPDTFWSADEPTP
jgi:hypothetical protein